MMIGVTLNSCSQTKKSFVFARLEHSMSYESYF